MIMYAVPYLPIKLLSCRGPYPAITIFALTAAYQPLYWPCIGTSSHNMDMYRGAYVAFIMVPYTTIIVVIYGGPN
jgi:hypothetical protein